MSVTIFHILKSNHRGVNSSRLLAGTDIQSPPLHETTAIWRMSQTQRPTNLLREFGSCNATSYTTVDLSCSDYSTFSNCIYK